MNYEVREECHSKFEDPVPEEKKSIYEYEDVSCLFAWCLLVCCLFLPCATGFRNTYPKDSDLSDG